jgi:SAM-dependent methyltransferase
MDAPTEVPAATAFTHWGTCPEPAMATFVMRRFGLADRVQINILDVGCGVGAQLFWLAEQGFGVRGIDISREAVERLHGRARSGKRLYNAGAGLGDVALNAGGFINENFDAAIDVCCLQHLDHDQVRKALAEIYRVLKPGGWLFSMTAGPMHDDVGMYLRRESWFEINRLYELPGFRVHNVADQGHSYTGKTIMHWIVEAQKP